MTPAIAALTMQKADTSIIRQKAIEEKMSLLIEDGIRIIKAGLTTIEEVLSVAAVEHEIAE